MHTKVYKPKMDLKVGVVAVILLTASWWTELDATALTFELPDNDKMCFYENFTTSDRYIFEYEVIRGGNNDVDVVLYSPNNKLLYGAQKERGDEFEFTASHGAFKFCFSNEFSTVTHKLVYFSLEPAELDSLQAEAGDSNPTVNTQLEESMESIHRSASRVVEYQNDYRLRETRGRYQAEELNDRVQWWSMAEGVVILIAGVGLVLVIKTFFSDRIKTNNFKSPTVTYIVE